MTLQEAWNKRKELRAEGDKFFDEGNKLYAEGDKFYAEEYKLYAEGKKLYAEGHKFYAEGDLVFITSVINMYGPKVYIHWLSNGAVQIRDENNQVLIKFE